MEPMAENANPSASLQTRPRRQCPDVLPTLPPDTSFVLFSRRVPRSQMLYPIIPSEIPTTSATESVPSHMSSVPCVPVIHDVGGSS